MGRSRFSFLLHSVQTKFLISPNLLFNGYGSFSAGIKLLGREVDHSTPPSAEVKNP
jgi:hypothetical protein